MGKDLVPTAKEINEAHLFAKECAETAIEHAVRCGELLAAKKTALPHGQWQTWVEQNCDFSLRAAQAYMQAADQKRNALRFSSLRQALGYDKKPDKPAQNSKQEAVPVVNPQGTGETGADRPVASIPSAPAPTAACGAPSAPSNEGAAPSTTEPEWTAEDEAQFQAEADADSRERIETAMESDDKLAEAYEQIKAQSREIVALKASRDHYMRQANEAVRLLKAEQRKVAKLERQQRAA